MTHDDVISRLDEYVDGQLESAEASALESHLAGCPACRAELEGLRALLVRAKALPRSITPPAMIWQAVERRTAGSRPAAVIPISRSRTRVFWLAAAAIALTVVSSALTSVWIRHGETRSGFTVSQAEYSRATAELAGRLEHNQAGLSPRTLAVLQRNLAIIDGAIAEAEAALRTDPGDPSLEEMLLARYRQRLELLQRAARAGQES
jgi:anti-sigma-K factor RskA